MSYLWLIPVYWFVGVFLRLIDLIYDGDEKTVITVGTVVEAMLFWWIVAPILIPLAYIVRAFVSVGPAWRRVMEFQLWAAKPPEPPKLSPNGTPTLSADRGSNVLARVRSSSRGGGGKTAW